MLEPGTWPSEDLSEDADAGAPDPGLIGQSDRSVAGVDNGNVTGYRVRFDEAGPDGRIRTSALLRYAQDIAWRHSEALGFDRRWYRVRGRWWVVRSVDLEVVAAVAMGRTLRVSTAVVGHRRIWARRLADARLAGGALAARIVTDWVILDDRGRLVRIPEDFGLSFTNPELAGEILRAELPAGMPDGHVGEIRCSVRPHDLDPMGHVNNATYFDWLEDGLMAAGLDVAALPRRARLEYLASAGPRDEVVVRTWLDSGSWAASIRRTNGEELLRAVGRVGPDGWPAATSGSALGSIDGVPPTGTPPGG